ncbi:FtsX-like permease family protein [Streptomyces sp. NPDC057966]|uniref:FtsX-like permease family protein n=1 Tax=Streptomyces sp. NPDC057966 TaxID=3346292 RepID=UPI0036F15CEB
MVRRRGHPEAERAGPELDTSALVGWPQATEHLGADGTTATVYLRAYPVRVPAVQAVAAATANPSAPSTVEVSQPSDLLTARNEAQGALTGLVLALAAVALLVGGVGIANSERHGAPRRDRPAPRAGGQGRSGRRPFLLEAVLMGLIGGVGGLIVGAATVYAYALAQYWPASIPYYTLAGGPLVSVLVAAVAGIYLAARAAKASPTDALRSA